MALCLVLGIACAVAHHLYYKSLDQQVVDEFGQEWTVRIGTGLSFLTRAFLVACAAMAFQQYTWLLWRSRPMSIGAIDGLMVVLGDLLPFLNFDLWRSAFGGVVVAIVIWCLPLATIAPPGSITIARDTFNASLSNVVPTINWRNIPYEVTGVGLYTEPGQDTIRLATATAYSLTYLPMPARHQNSIYNVSFSSPKVRCGSVPAEDQERFDELLLLNSTVPGLELYYNSTSFAPSSYKDNNYDLWVRTASRNFTCQTWNATYDLTFDFTNGSQNIKVQDVHYLERLPLRKPIARFTEAELVLQGIGAWFDSVSELLLGALTVGGAQAYLTATTNVLQLSLAA